MLASARQLENHTVTKGRRRCSGRARPQRASSRRDNLQKPVAPRRPGSWVPSPRTQVAGKELIPMFAAVHTGLPYRQPEDDRQKLTAQ